MRIFFLIAAFLCPFIAGAQRITIDDLSFVFTHSLNEVNNYLDKKDFRFMYARNLADSMKAYRFQSQKKQFVQYTGAYRSFSKNYKKETCFSSDFDTYDKDEYEGLKNEIKSLGFTLQHRDSIHGNLFYTYRKGKIEINLLASPTHDDTHYFPPMSYSIRYSDFALTNKLFHYKKSR